MQRYIKNKNGQESSVAMSRTIDTPFWRHTICREDIHPDLKDRRNMNNNKGNDALCGDGEIKKEYENIVLHSDGKEVSDTTVMNMI